MVGMVSGSAGVGSGSGSSLRSSSRVPTRLLRSSGSVTSARGARVL